MRDAENQRVFVFHAVHNHVFPRGQANWDRSLPRGNAPGSQPAVVGRSGGDVVKRYVGWLGYDVEDFAGHSLRASLATSAAGKSERAKMNQTGHRSLPTVRRFRDGNLFRDNAAGCEPFGSEPVATTASTMT